MERVTISDAEWEVMHVVWQQPPVPASRIVEQLSARRQWHPRTIRTLIARLVKKGALTARRDRNRYLYWPRVSKELCVRAESQGFMERVFGGEPANMLVHLIRHTDLTRDEIRELRRILSEKRR